MSEESAAPVRRDPYVVYRFRVGWQGRDVAGVTRVSPLARTTDVIRYRLGGDASRTYLVPGATAYDPITLKRGITVDEDFESWADATPHASSVATPDLRRDLTITLLDEAAQVVRAYLVRRCWVSRYVALPELDANSNAVTFESITLQNEGWERVSPWA